MSLPALSLYIHWPYCARICPYCDFNVYKAKPETGAALTAAIVKDLAFWRNLSGERRIVSVHFGGGTPSLMTAAQIEKILESARTQWSFETDCEIALEANPSDASDDKWNAFKSAGINRLSLGIQSFDDEALTLLGRDHSGAQAKTALDLSAQIFPRVSADLIFGHKAQSQALLRQDLDVLISSGIGHISAYQLTIENGTAFGKALTRGRNMAVGADASADFYDQVKTALTGAGFKAYEVSNYARPNQRSLHNMAYWTGADYAGIGPGAHGRITTETGRLATIAALNPTEYTNTIDLKGQALTERSRLPPKAQAAEYVMMGLRISEGLSLRRLFLMDENALDKTAVAEMVSMGLLFKDANRLRATEAGRLVLDSVTGAILN